MGPWWEKPPPAPLPSRWLRVRSESCSVTSRMRPRLQHRHSVSPYEQQLSSGPPREGKSPTAGGRDRLPQGQVPGSRPPLTLWTPASPWASADGLAGHAARFPLTLTHTGCRLVARSTVGWGQKQSYDADAKPGRWGLNACVPLKFMCWTPPPSVMALGGDAFREV